MNYLEHIEIKSEVRFGKPILKGTRIAVADVLNWLANGLSEKQIIEDYPELSVDAIRACLLYAASREGHIGIG